MFLLNKNIFLLIAICIILIIKNNSNYRFNLLIKVKGKVVSKSDDECVYLYAWCTLLRYFLILAKLYLHLGLLLSLAIIAEM